MRTCKLTLLLWMAALIAGGVGGCKCGKDKGGSTTGGLTNPAITEANPEVPPLSIDFPQKWRSQDEAINTFIESALKTAAKGDYDGFRQLFAMVHSPPSRQEFQRVWEAVEAIRVAGLYGDGPVPQKYYLHALVDRRQPDRKGRLTLNVIVMVFREAGQWRLGPASREVEDVILRAATQPATGPATSKGP